MVHILLFNQVREIAEFQFGNLKGIDFKSPTVGLCFQAKNTPSSIYFFDLAHLATQFIKIQC